MGHSSTRGMCNGATVRESRTKKRRSWEERSEEMVLGGGSRPKGPEYWIFLRIHTPTRDNPFSSIAGSRQQLTQ